MFIWRNGGFILQNSLIEHRIFPKIFMLENLERKSKYVKFDIIIIKLFYCNNLVYLCYDITNIGSYGLVVLTIV